MAQSTDLLAVLFDADNVQHSQVGSVLSRAARLGTVAVKRAYGDWTTQTLNGWKPVANQHVIQPVQQFANTTGKNATDSALIIDAMDLLHSRRFQGFCIVSSDSDFTRLATRIREEGIPVYGFGKTTTPAAFRNACSEFTYLDAVKKPASLPSKPVTALTAPGAQATQAVGQTKAAAPNAQPPAAKTKPASQQSKAPSATTSRTPQRVAPAQLRSDAQLVSGLRNCVASACGDDGWADLAAVGSLMSTRQPGFASRSWGYAKLSDLIRSTELFVVEARPAGGARVRDTRSGV
ncbi:NYN domain-containing protein [Agrococcus sp. Ld7]|uniref:NYN domain-containing protein n=1 Tax=Agrococcus sp. Ld7 TaxID=649148 RepID=UPI0038651235